METMCGVTMDYPGRLNDIVGCDGLGDVVEASTDVVYQFCFVIVFFFVYKKKNREHLWRNSIKLLC